MNRIRIVGLALVAMLALGATVASSASASEFKAENYPVEVKGEGANQEFKVESGTINCTGKFSGSASAASETLGITAAYEKCTFASLGLTTVNMEGCTYLFHAGAEIEGNPARHKGTVDVKCPTGKEITVTTATCVVKVGAQSGLTGVEYVNTGTGSARKVEVNANVETIAYTEGTLCTAPGKHTNGHYTGKVVTTGRNSETLAADGIWVEGL
jgi:hypothetical protein